MVNELEINNTRYEQSKRKLHAIGLPEIVKEIDPKNPWLFNPDLIILDPNGQAIVCTNNWESHIEDVASILFDYEIKSIRFTRNNQNPAYFTSPHRLTIPERKAFEIMVNYFDMYFPGINAEHGEVMFPKGMSAYGAPAHYVNESDAYEAAEVIGQIINRDNLDVVQTDGGYAVVVCNNRNVYRFEGYEFACVLGACKVLEDFSVIRKQKELFDINDYAEGNIPWQTATGKRYTQQARVEKKLDQIIQSLNAMQKTDEIQHHTSCIEARHLIAEPEPAGA